MSNDVDYSIEIRHINDNPLLRNSTKVTSHYRLTTTEQTEQSTLYMLLDNFVRPFKTQKVCFSTDLCHCVSEELRRRCVNMGDSLDRPTTWLIHFPCHNNDWKWWWDFTVSSKLISWNANSDHPLTFPLFDVKGTFGWPDLCRSRCDVAQKGRKPVVLAVEF